MFPLLGNVHLEWVKLAEESVKQGDYETAANHMRRVAHYFRLNKDMARFREFMRKTGDYYLLSAEKFWDSDQYEKASLLYIKAIGCYKETEDYALAKNCSLLVQKFYATTVKDAFANFQGSPLDLKCFGDYFRGEDEIEKARECYEASAKKAAEQGKLILAGGLYRDAGDCSSLLDDVERFAINYAMAADSYFESRKHFEAAWHYNMSGFLLISLRRFDEALQMARKAKHACLVGTIPVLLNHLSTICELLSEKDYIAAKEEWQRIRNKFKENYINLIDSCFNSIGGREEKF